MMDAEVAKMLEDFEARRMRLIARAGALAPEVQTRRPDSKTWSPAEVIDHCAQSEDFYLKIMDAASSEELGRMRPKKSFGYRMVLWTLRRAIRVPSIKGMEPTDDVDLESAIEHWDRVRGEFRKRFEGKKLGDVAIKHPMFGPMSVEQVMLIFDAHMGYHEKHFPA